MSESFFEDLNDVFPINSQVRCGQAAFRLGFAHMTLDDSEQLQPAHLQRSKKGRFMPRVPLKKRSRSSTTPPNGGVFITFLDPPHGIAG